MLIDKNIFEKYDYIDEGIENFLFRATSVALWAVIFLTAANELGIKVIERQIHRSELYLADEVFLTGTAAEVTPVSQISNYNFKVCKTISDLSDAYQSLVRKKTAA